MTRRMTGTKSWTLVRAGVLAFSIALIASPARADGTRPLAPDVDFSRPPAQVEGYNKARITCETDVRPAGRFFRITGKAYYPDGVTFTVTLRYWKHAEPFARGRAQVRERAFSLELGPYTKIIPGGEIVAEAWFQLTSQPKAMQKRLVDEKYMSCTPPCHFDRYNATRVNVSMGGLEAQRADEKLEKEQLVRGLDAITQAFGACEQVCLAARQNKGTKEQAAAALTRLEADLKAAADQIAAWRVTRQFLLFPSRFNATESLAAMSLDAGRLHAIVAGVKVEGASGSGAFDTLARTLPELKEKGESLRGFTVEVGSLDREWEKLNNDARAKWDEAMAPADETSTTPAAPPKGR